MKIRWLRLALNDLDEIAEYISKDNPEIATKLIQLIWNKVQLLKDHPHIGRPGRVENTKELYIESTPFIIPYRVINKNIEILRVFHTSRKWPGKFGL